MVNMMIKLHVYMYTWNQCFSYTSLTLYMCIHYSPDHGVGLQGGVSICISRRAGWSTSDNSRKGWVTRLLMVHSSNNVIPLCLYFVQFTNFITIDGSIGHWYRHCHYLWMVVPYSVQWVYETFQVIMPSYVNILLCTCVWWNYWVENVLIFWAISRLTDRHKHSRHKHSRQHKHSRHKHFMHPVNLCKHQVIVSIENVKWWVN